MSAAKAAEPRNPPDSVEGVKEQESLIILPSFDASQAWKLGTALRTRLLNVPIPMVIHISTTSNPGNVLFHAVTHDGVAPDNDIWIQRKKNTVVRYACSSWLMHCKFEGQKEPEAAFREKFMLGDKAGDYAIHGGAVPVRVKGVSGVVAVVVVSGWKQEWDHQVVVEEMEKLKKAIEEGH